MTQALLAFHNDPAIQQKYIQRVLAHQAADEIVQGTYWDHGKGCAVGCTIHSGNHAYYESELGVPRELAYLQDRIFEGLSNEEAKPFPAAFLHAIHLGADLSLVVSRFLAWLLIDEQYGVVRFARNAQGKEAITTIATLYQRKFRGETITIAEWRAAAADAADAAAADAAAAAAAAAYAAAVAAAYAADAYAAAAADAYAADAAAAVAAAADAAAAAAADARKAHFVVMRDKLLDLLHEA